MLFPHPELKQASHILLTELLQIYDKIMSNLSIIFYAIKETYLFT